MPSAPPRTCRARARDESKIVARRGEMKLTADEIAYRTGGRIRGRKVNSWKPGAVVNPHVRDLALLADVLDRLIDDRVNAWSKVGLRASATVPRPGSSGSGGKL